MFRAIVMAIVVLTLICACLLGLSQLASVVLRRPLSAAELVATVVALVVIAIVVLLRRKRHTQRKYLNMQDSALW